MYQQFEAIREEHLEARYIMSECDIPESPDTWNLEDFPDLLRLNYEIE